MVIYELQYGKKRWDEWYGVPRSSLIRREGRGMNDGMNDGMR